MPGSLHSLLTRLGRWPRRVAALGCLLLAGGAALAHPSGAPAAHDRPHGIAASLRPGEVAVPVDLDPARSTGYLHAGDRIGLMTSADEPITGAAPPTTLVADRLRVLAVNTGGADLGADQAATVLVAADRDTALRITAASSRPLRPVLDETR